MSAKAMSLKAKIRNIARKKNVPAQVILQNYMFERWLLRLAKSDYSEKFVVKGGILIAAMVGLESRATMDLDTMLRQLTLNEESVYTAVKEICSIELKDGVSLSADRIAPIRDDDVYGGFRVFLTAVYDTIEVPLNIDVTTGDAVTPEPTKHLFKCIFDEKQKFTVWSYNVETVLSEKIETILRRGIFNTRPRDFYDAYVLLKTQEVNKEIFFEALANTARHRGTMEQIADTSSRLMVVKDSMELKQMWEKYRKQFAYAKDIEYEEIIAEIASLLIK